MRTDSGPFSVDICRGLRGRRRQEAQRYLQGQHDHFQFPKGKVMTPAATALGSLDGHRLEPVGATVTGQLP